MTAERALPEVLSYINHPYDTSENLRVLGVKVDISEWDVPLGLQTDYLGELLGTYERSELSALRAENARLREALRPFTHPDLLKATGGTVQGDDSPVYGRDKATLKLGDFRRAHRALTETEAS